MIVIYAEKPDVGSKIAAALDCITLAGSGKQVSFEHLESNLKAIKSQQYKDGFLKINFNGEETYVTWGIGHLCELKQAYDYDADYKNWSKLPMPFIPNQYGVKVKEETKKQFTVVKGLLSKCRLVINATDFDREGELIFYYLMTAANCKKPFMRAHYSSQTKDSFKTAFANLKTPAQVKNITNAGRGRSIADWVMGSNLTVALSLKYPMGGVLSVGRVQTPTLNMLVERELAIRDFKSEKYYTVEAEFTTRNGEAYTAEHKSKRFDQISDASEIMKKINGKNGMVSEIEKKTTSKAAPSLHDLSSLQMLANARHGFTLAKTLELAQKLYEGGFTTYPRTDSHYLTDDMENVVNKVLDQLETMSEYKCFIIKRPRKFDKKKYFDSSRVSSHFAIIPTGVIPKNLSPDEQKIYDIIARSVIMMIYNAASIEKTTVITSVEGEAFVSNGSTIIDKGWMAVDDLSKEQFLPLLSRGEIVNGKYEMKDKMTEPPKRYTDKTLVSAMITAGKELDDEELKKVMDSGVKGIGTNATRASIIEGLVRRGYAERNKKSIVATEKGISLIQTLPLKEIKSAELTAIWENRLNKIAEGQDDFDSFIGDIEEQTKKWCNEITVMVPQKNSINNEGSGSLTASTGLTCPVCGRSVDKKSWGWGCSGYRDGCKFTIGSSICGKKLTDAQVKSLIETGSTKQIKGFKSKAGKTFDAKLVLDQSKKITFDFSK